MLKHLCNRQPRVAILGSYLGLYDRAFPGYGERVHAFAQEVVQALEAHVEVVSLDLTTCVSQAEEHVRKAEAANVDALMIMSLGYTNSLTVTGPLIDTRLPLLFFNTQSLAEVTSDYSFENLLDNHGTQGIQDITSILVRAGRRFGIVTGLVGQKDTLEMLVDRLNVLRAASQIRGSRFTRLGDPQAGMGDMNVDLSQLNNVFGLEYLNLSGFDLAEASREASREAIIAARELDRQHFEISPDLLAEDHERCLRLEIGLRSLVVEHRLAGLTMSFDSIVQYPGIETVPFLGICKLMADGMAYAGEGDLLATAGGILTRCLCGQVNFTEIYTMDFSNNAVLNSHMAEGNWRMARKDRKPRLLRREFSLAKCKPFASLAFSLNPGVVTLFDLTLTTDGRFHFITLLAEVDDFPPLELLEIPNFKLRFARDIREILNEYSLMGGTHHLSMAYGDHRRQFRLLAGQLDCVCSDIQTG